MIVFVEGPDNVGKSTQIKNIFRALVKKDSQPVHVVHYAAIPGLTEEESRAYSEEMYRDMFELAYWAHSRGSHVIFDRAHIGEMVYSPLYRNYSGDYVLKLESDFLRRDASVLMDVLLLTFVDLPENLIKRDDGLSFTIELEQKKLEIKLFFRAYELSKIPGKIVEIQNKDKDVVWEEIKPYITGEF